MNWAPEDHAHALLGFKATHRICDLLRDLKGGTSQWVHETLGMPEFVWQEGYGAFTVSATARDGVKAYIANQAEHHRTKTFREELVELLKRAGIQYDPKYLE